MRDHRPSRTKRGRYAGKRGGAVTFRCTKRSLHRSFGGGDGSSVEELEALRRESDYKTAKEQALAISARGYTAHQLKGEALPATPMRRFPRRGGGPVGGAGL